MSDALIVAIVAVVVTAVALFAAPRIVKAYRRPRWRRSRQ